MGNELLELVVTQAHDDEVFKSQDPNRKPPTLKGPGVTRKIHASDDLEKLESNPRIAECVTSVEFLTSLFLLSEDLGPEELRKGRQVVTGAALRVRERGRAPGESPRFRSRDATSGSPGRRSARSTTSTPRTGASGRSTRTSSSGWRWPISTYRPTDPKELLDVASRKMTLGLASTIDVIQAMENLNREQAIEMYQRVQDDFEQYPPQKAPAPEQEPGSFADTMNDVRGKNGRPPSDSVADAVNDISAADRRANRRAS